MNKSVKMKAEQMRDNGCGCAAVRNNKYKLEIYAACIQTPPLCSLRGGGGVEG